MDRNADFGVLRRRDFGINFKELRWNQPTWGAPGFEHTIVHLQWRQVLRAKRFDSFDRKRGESWPLAGGVKPKLNRQADHLVERHAGDVDLGPRNEEAAFVVRTEIVGL